MLTVNTITEEQWPVLKDVRLRALADTPEAFSTTLAQAQGYSEGEWQVRAHRFAEMPLAAGYLAFQDGIPCGMATCYLSAANADAGELTAFWVAPAARGQGVGEALVARIVEWAAAQGLKTLRAWVMEGNTRAIAFYRKNGFEETGDREKDEEKWVLLMARLLKASTP